MYIVQACCSQSTLYEITNLEGIFLHLMCGYFCGHVSRNVIENGALMVNLSRVFNIRYIYNFHLHILGVFSQEGYSRWHEYNAGRENGGEIMTQLSAETGKTY